MQDGPKQHAQVLLLDLRSSEQQRDAVTLYHLDSPFYFILQ